MRAVYWLLAGIVVPLAFACGASVKVADPLPLSESKAEGPAVALPIPEDHLSRRQLLRIRTVSSPLQTLRHLVLAPRWSESSTVTRSRSKSAAISSPSGTSESTLPKLSTRRVDRHLCRRQLEEYSVRPSACPPPALLVVPDRESFSCRTGGPPRDHGNWTKYSDVPIRKKIHLWVRSFFR